MQVAIGCYGDLAMLREAVKSVPSGIPIHVCDGRHATFDGETDLTPGARAFCGRHPDCHYHAPDPDRLPFGHADAGRDPAFRWPQFRKARWTNYEAIPGEAWTLKLDTDERIRRLDVEPEDLDRDVKYRATVRMASREHTPPRLWVPERWTFWVGDLSVHRSRVGRETGPKRVKQALPWQREQSLEDSIVIENVGHERPADYRRRRNEQKQTFNVG